MSTIFNTFLNLNNRHYDLCHRYKCLSSILLIVIIFIEIFVSVFVMPQDHNKPHLLIRPFVVLALPGMYLFYKYNQYKRKRKENTARRMAERELAYLNNKIVSTYMYT